MTPSTVSAGLQNANGPSHGETLNAANLTERSETPPAIGSPYLNSRPGIPAWQLAAREKAQAPNEEEPVQT